MMMMNAHQKLVLLSLFSAIFETAVHNISECMKDSWRAVTYVRHNGSHSTKKDFSKNTPV